MGILSIRQRVVRLERSGLFASVVAYAPLTQAEIREIADPQRCMQMDHGMIRRLEALSPIVDGETIISAFRRIINVKRILGVDLTMAL